MVVASAGNEGPLHGTLSNGAPWVLTVGAGTIDREFHGILTLGNGMQITFVSMYPGNSSLTQVSLVFLNGCKSVEEMKKNKNKIVVCKDNLSLSTQVYNAKSARVYGAIFISNYSLPEFATKSSFPTAFLGLQEGQTVIDYIKRNNSIPRGSLIYHKTVIGTKPAPMVDIYNSRGPFPSCPSVLKPDLLAPGSSILASWCPTSPVAEVRSKPLFSKFNLESGTSMSAPHVAGVAALIKEVHPDWSPAAIRSALMTTASSLDNTLSPIKDRAYNKRQASPLDIGAGHINPNKALDPGLVYDATAEDYVKLLCAMNYTAAQIRIITKSTYNCENRSLDLNYPSFIVFFNEYDSNSDAKVVHEFRRTVTNVREGRWTYTANVTGMNGLIKVKVEPEKLVFKQKYEKQSYKLSLEGPKPLKEVVAHGSLSWVNDDGKYVVRSPIVVTIAEVRSKPLFSKFNLESGTSMSAPHVAGVAALIKEVHPDWSPAAIRSALMTTASSLDNTLSPIKDRAYNKRQASPLDIGAGHINPNKALDPGLVYDATAEDYVKLLCAMNYTAAQIRIITKSTYNCENRSLDLNYPSFIVFFNEYDSNSDAKVVHEFRRTVTNVREGRWTYTANVTGMNGLIKVKVEPEKLLFKQKYEKQSYKLSLEGPKPLKEVVVHGSLSWVNDDGKYVVRSPIVVTSLVPESLLRA
ncbi:subtilisin-like protease sbt1.9 [Quercus suber]|uniref:Subtilisin-like protease sbt1.9 n=1 Tax=Quercus suber TaxID=58331 RepID=A0AAW0JJJ2_QUESU